MMFAVGWILFVEAVLARMSRLCLVGIFTGIAILAALISPFIGILMVGFLVWCLQPSPQRSDTHGSARWATIRDLTRAGCIFQKSGLTLGYYCHLVPTTMLDSLSALFTYSIRRSREAVAIASSTSREPRPIKIRLPDQYPHLSVYGPSGSGKSTCFVIPAARDLRENMVILDAKGEIARLTAKRRARRFGHEIALIDPFGVADGCGFPRARFNPALLFREDTATLVDEARRMASAMIVNTGNEKDPFWNKSSNALVTGVLSFLMADARPEEANFNRLRDILTDLDLMEEALSHMAQSDSCGGLLRRLAGQIRQLQGQTKASVYSVANSHLEFLDSLPLAETLSESTFDARQLIHGKLTVYVCLPVDRVTELSGLQRVIISSLINVLFEAGEDRHRRVRFLLDEAATLGPMESLYNAVQFGRSFGHRMTFYFQSASQIERCFPESQAADFRGTVASCFCGVNDTTTAKEVSEWIGQTTVTGRSSQSGWNDSNGETKGMTDRSTNRNHGTSFSTSESEVGRALMQPEEVLQMLRHRAIVLLPNVPPILAEKVPYFKRVRARFLSRLTVAVAHSLFIAAAACLFAIAGWACATGQAMPAIAEMRQAFVVAVNGG